MAKQGMGGGACERKAKGETGGGGEELKGEWWSCKLEAEGNICHGAVQGRVVAVLLRIVLSNALCPMEGSAGVWQRALQLT